ncbi:hypothetical protein [Flammeovirga kamogawensis]|nr:hypothetical protein [Flammeovirga kamogawensis]
MKKLTAFYQKYKSYMRVDLLMYLTMIVALIIGVLIVSIID